MRIRDISLRKEYIFTSPGWSARISLEDIGVEEGISTQTGKCESSAKKNQDMLAKWQFLDSVKAIRETLLLIAVQNKDGIG